MPEIFGFEVDTHPPSPLPIGKGELSEREGAIYAPSLKSLPLLLNRRRG